MNISGIKSLGAWLVVGLLSGVSTAYAQDSWQLSDISGHLPDLRFTLTDDHNRQVTQQDYQGEIVLLYFGFTGCSTQCPLTLTRLARLMQQLGNDNQKMHVLFVTVDPANDTPARLHRYLQAFDPSHMTGLTGTNGDIEALAKRYRAAYRRETGVTHDIPHSNIIYIFDSSGRACLLATPEDSDEKILHDLRELSHDAS